MRGTIGRTPCKFLDVYRSWLEIKGSADKTVRFHYEGYKARVDGDDMSVSVTFIKESNSSKSYKRGDPTSPEGAKALIADYMCNPDSGIGKEVIKVTLRDFKRWDGREHVMYERGPVAYEDGDGVAGGGGGDRAGSGGRKLWLSLGESSSDED